MELLSKSGAKNSPYLTLGKITAPHGLRGALKVFLISDFPERLLDLEEVFLLDSPESHVAKGPYQVEHVQQAHGKNYLVFIEEIQTREAAEAVSKCFLAVSDSERFDLPEDTYYARDLIGFKVLSEAGEEIGEISQIIQNEQDLLVLKTPDQREHWIPFVRDLVPEVRIERREIVIVLLDGLLDL